jgi:tRNA 2-selenouridine synthase
MLYGGAMPINLTSIADVTKLGFDTIIDVRSPAEFAEDHLPGAINLPVLDDAERAEVGTIYKQVNPFTARKLGAAMVAANAARHLLGPLADKPGGWQPLVYCWRGGQRSGSFATILGQVGWRVETIAGGYRAWRGLVVKALYDQAMPCPVIVLDGNTGSAKTDVLNRMPALGVQVIDLEGLARHRGSLFGAMPVLGAMPAGQPSQKAFEGALALALSQLDPTRPVLVEAESSKVGNCRLPPRLWRAMVDAPRIAIKAGVAARAAYLTRAYADLTEDATRLAAIIDRLRPSHSAKQIEDWQAMAARADFAPLAESLMQEHYDPRYEKHRARMTVPLTELEAEGLDDPALDDLARQVAAAINREPEDAAVRPSPARYSQR